MDLQDKYQSRVTSLQRYDADTQDFWGRMLDVVWKSPLPSIISVLHFIVFKMSGTWRDTLFIWCGELAEETAAKSDGSTSKGRRYVTWKGTWIGCEDCGDARTAPTPTSFAKSSMTFQVSGWLEEHPSKNDDKASSVWKVNLTDGPGWDLDDGSGTVSKYTDTEHVVYMEHCPLQVSQEHNDTLIVAKGTNEFGPFISAGYPCSEDGKHLMIARRYLEEGDKRAEWTVDDLYQRVKDANQTIHITVAPNLSWRIGPWRTVDLHASEKAFDKAMRAQTTNKRQKRSKSDKGSPSFTEDVLMIDLNISSKRFSSKLSLDTTTPHTKLISNVQWLEQCFGCGKAVKLGTQPLSCVVVDVVEYNTTEDDSKTLGQAVYCTSKCTIAQGAKSWANLGRDYQEAFPDSKRWLESRSDSSSTFWDATLANTRAAKQISDAGWKKDDRGNVRLECPK